VSDIFFYPSPDPQPSGTTEYVGSW
jgi:hypothetical protein